MKKIVSVLATSVAIAAIVPATAFAWTYSLQGNGACQPDGSFQVTWTITNPESQTLTVRQSSAPTVVSVGATVSAKSSKAFNQTFDGTKTGNHSLTVSVNWPGDLKLRQLTKSVDQKVVCTQPQGGQGGGTPQTPETPATPAVESASVAPAIVPVGAVDAGEGSASQNINLAAVSALVVSALAVTIGVIRRVTQKG
jgi:hypothetical protein